MILVALVLDDFTRFVVTGPVVDLAIVVAILAKTVRLPISEIQEAVRLAVEVDVRLVRRLDSTLEFAPRVDLPVGVRVFEGAELFACIGIESQEQVRLAVRRAVSFLLLQLSVNEVVPLVDPSIEVSVEFLADG